MESEPSAVVVDLADEERATLELGESIGRHLEAGQWVALVGEMGSGKTCLTRGLARGLSVYEPDEVTSPTYLMVVEHAGARVDLVHIDAYLPQKAEAFLLDGGLDYLEELAGAVVVVEWADRLRGLIRPADLRIELVPIAAGGRRVTLRSRSDTMGWLGDLRSTV